MNRVPAELETTREHRTLKTASTSLSIVIPAYNEESRIDNTLAQVLRFAEGYPASVEVIVVDDGSTDSTSQRVEAVASRRDGPGALLRLIRHPVNRGKGAGVRTGFRQATGEVVMFTDADLAAPITEAAQIIEPIASGACDVAVGSRALDPSRIARRQGVARRLAGRLFNLAVRWITGVRIRDTQCGFKAFRRKAARPLFARQRLDRFAFDVELLYLATKLGLRIQEVPVRWSHVDFSTVSTFRDGFRMGLDLCRIRWYDWVGRYG